MWTFLLTLASLFFVLQLCLWHTQHGDSDEPLPLVEMAQQGALAAACAWLSGQLLGCPLGPLLSGAGGGRGTSQPFLQANLAQPPF